MSSSSKQLVLGIDGGGSKTLVSLAEVSSDYDPHVIAQGTAGASNLNAVDFEAASEQVNLAIQRAFESAAIPPGSVARLCMGMSGAGRSTEQDAWLKWAAEKQVAIQTCIVTDAETVLSAGTPEGIGVALISGTGSLAYGENKTGEVARAGGWGYLLGDAGSGYQIAMNAIRAILKSFEGRGPNTCLQTAFLQTLGLDDAGLLLSFVYRSENQRSKIAALSKLVFEAAASDDSVAQTILQEASEELAELVKTVASRLHFSNADYSLALTGGILLHQPDYRMAVLAHLQQLQAEPSTIECVEDASLGAIRIAARMLNDRA